MNPQPLLIPAAAPSVTLLEVAQLTAWLRGAGWRSAAEIGAALHWGERKVRAIANASGGAILSYPGSPGYRLTREASAEERDAAIARLRHQAREMAGRAGQIARTHHQHHPRQLP